MPPSNPATTLRPSTAVKPNRSALHSVGIGTPPDPETNRSGNTIFSDPGPRCTCPFEKYGLASSAAARPDRIAVDAEPAEFLVFGAAPHKHSGNFIEIYRYPL